MTLIRSVSEASGAAYQAYSPASRDVYVREILLFRGTSITFVVKILKAVQAQHRNEHSQHHSI